MKRSAPRCILIALVFSLVWLGGCAYNQALKKAEELSDQEQWQQAYAQCQRALSLKPDSLEAKACVEQTGPEAIESLLEDARSDLEEKRYADAIAHIDEADTIAGEPVVQIEQLRADVRKAVNDRLDAHLMNGEMLAAYRFVGAASELYPGASFVSDAYANLREHYHYKATQAADQGRFADAFVALDVIVQNDPEGRARANDMRSQMRLRWAASLEQEARSMEQDGHLAGAAVYLVRASDQRASGGDAGGASELLSQARENAQRSRQFTRVSMNWTIAASDGWRATVDNNLVQYLAGDPDVSTADGSADIELDISMQSTDCGSALQGTARASTDYVAGTRTVENPRYNKLAAERNQLQRDLQAARRDESNLAQSYNRVEASYQQYYRDVIRPLQTKLQSAKQREQQAEKDADSAGRMADDARDQMSRLRSDPNASESNITRSEQVVQMYESRERTAEQALTGALQQRQQIENSLRARMGEYERLESTRDRLYRQHQSAKKQVRQLNARARTVQNQLASTPRTLDEKIVKTFTYNVETWRQSCASTLAVTSRAADGAGPIDDTLSASAFGEDTYHDAYPRYGIEEDALQYPFSEAQLLESVDEQLIEKLRAFVSQRVRAWGQRGISRALERTEQTPHRSADVLLSSYLVYGNLMQGSDLEAFRSLLEETYGASPIQRLASGN